MVVADLAAAFAPAGDNDVISLLLGVTNNAVILSDYYLLIMCLNRLSSLVRSRGGSRKA